MQSDNYRFDQNFFHKEANKNYQNSTLEFKKIIKNFAFFNFGFFLILFFQLTLFAYLFSYLSSSYVLALILGSIFLSSFSYFILLFYLQAKKNDQIIAIKDKFIKTCKRAISMPEDTIEHRLTLAHAASRFADSLLNFENEIYFSFKKKFLLKFIKKISFSLHKEDVFKLKEKLFLSAIEEHIKQIKSTPTDLELHASLASSYFNLSKLYLDADEKKLVSKNILRTLDQKYQFCVKSMIEEFKILNDYAPNDPWVHMQLAKSYRALNLKEKEAKENEIILRLSPENNKILYRLARLYFELGKTAKALRIYEDLKYKNYQHADSLLESYGSISLQDLFEENL
jgi:tetratricopeptide (TPR) repeat protein